MKHDPGVSNVSRRVALKAMAGVAGVGCALEFATSPASAAKMSQKAVGYQGSPKGAQSCGNCSLFVTPNACQSVDGAISPQGWCKIYVKKA